MVAVSVENACVLCFCMKSCKSTLHVEVFPTASEFRLSKCGSQQLLKSTSLLLSFLSKRVSTKSVLVLVMVVAPLYIVAPSLPVLKKLLSVKTLDGMDGLVC